MSAEKGGDFEDGIVLGIAIGRNMDSIPWQVMESKFHNRIGQEDRFAELGRQFVFAHSLDMSHQPRLHEMSPFIIMPAEGALRRFLKVVFFSPD